MSSSSLYRGRIETYVTIVGKRTRCQIKFTQGGFVITFHVVVIKAEREMTLAQIRLQPKRLERLGVGLLLERFNRFVEMKQITCHGREARMGKSELRIERDRLFKKIHR
jgi:hypothetical protein